MIHGIIILISSLVYTPVRSNHRQCVIQFAGRLAAKNVRNSTCSAGWFRMACYASAISVAEVHYWYLTRGTCPRLVPTAVWYQPSSARILVLPSVCQSYSGPSGIGTLHNLSPRESRQSVLETQITQRWFRHRGEFYRLLNVETCVIVRHQHVHKHLMNT